MTLGTAAIRSMVETRVDFSQAGAYSLMYSAVISASGKATTNAMIATSMVPTMTAAIPSLSCDTDHRVSVKNRSP